MELHLALNKCYMISLTLSDLGVGFHKPPDARRKGCEAAFSHPVIEDGAELVDLCHVASCTAEGCIPENATATLAY
jgi:hypothetical protein